VTGIRFWVITHGTRDYGDRFVVRIHLNGVPAREPVGICDTIEEAQLLVETSSSYPLVCLERFPEDDPVIMESWASKTAVEAVRKWREAILAGGGP
jgi:hypothetical protein